MNIVRRGRTFAIVALTLLGARPLAPVACDSRAPAMADSTSERPSAAITSPAVDAVKQRAAQAFGELPMRFEKNRRQPGDGSKFIARGATFDLSIKPAGAVFHIHSGKRPAAASPREPLLSAPQARAQQRQLRASCDPRRKTVSLKLIGANRRARAVGESELSGRTNYLIGNDTMRWRTEVANYARVKVESVYRGVDVVYYGSGRQVEYDFNVAPGASYRAIRLRFSGVDRLWVDESGDLVLATAAGTLRQHKPIAYQLVDGARREVDSSYVIRGNRDVGFDIGGYDRSRPLIIDPVLSYSTFFGGGGSDVINGIALDALGNAYVAGATDSSDLAISSNAFQSRGGIRSILSVGFVAKFDLANNRILYSTYIGGSQGPGGFSASSECLALAIDTAGNVYVTGRTAAVDFPTTAGAVQPVLAGGIDAFVAKLNTTGSALVYSTYLGSSKAPAPFFAALDEGYGIAVDAAGSAYVTGRTIGSDFPVTAGAFKTAHDHDTGFVGDVDPAMVSFTDAFVTKLNTTGTALVYSSYLGGAGDDSGNAIAIDPAGNACVAGTTAAPDFPTSNPLQASPGGSTDAFVARLNQAGSALIYSTYIGGAGADAAKAIAIDRSGSVYVAGTTLSTDLPVTAGAFQPASADVNIHKSTNGGATWAASSAGIPGDSSISQIVVDPANGSTLYAGAEGLVYNSTDGGQHWNGRRSANNASPSLFAFAPKMPSVIYGVSGTGFFVPMLVRSVNGGRTFEFINSSFPTFGPIRTFVGLTVDPVDDSILYAGTDKGLFRSTGGGAWVDRGKGLPGGGAFATVLAIDPSNPNRIFARASQGLFVSSNGGKKWGAASLGDASIANVTFDTVMRTTVYASGGGLFKSTDSGDSWQEIDNDLATLGVGKIIIDPTNQSVLYTTTSRGAFKSTDGGRRWASINDGLRPNPIFQFSLITSLALDPRNPATLYAVEKPAGSDAFVAKLSPSGSTLVYLTYLGGSGNDSAAGIALDLAGNAYICGQSASEDFPIRRALQPDRFFLSDEVFAAKLNADGAGLAYSTYLGGSFADAATGIAVDGFGNAYIVGRSSSADFPLANPLQSSFRSQEGFLARIVEEDSSQPAPSIFSVSPQAGASTGLNLISISGANFLPGARVRLGGVPATIAGVTSSLINAIVNGRQAGVGDVVVSNPDGQTAVIKKGYTFLPVPEINFAAIEGKELKVLGFNFDKGSVILLNGVAQKTRQELSGSSAETFLISKKAAKRIAPGQSVTIQVSSAIGLVSAPLSYTRPLPGTQSH